ncbi:adenosylcobinamide-phosphate synthase CbiB [Thermosediminibacter oceani]|uniref:Cobalamin biosynthesis protein CobD n=1 Tax=Thermosediminibacter oceani (strain ATCC BAA-1034 / DSM 16646 / JW/IW-1228P) TaxID=555079 RepID=D9RXV0_THEOJ|nr:adenosylcobinamide-phosphate synthase CbiB [Thermosediminibacter oceani]ADL08174.1 cobalamin biosynthesis protein CobD [Thermosediminibacter oceani DSM 16646]
MDKYHTAIIILCAFVLDLLLGDPRRPTHPVVLTGKLIAYLEKILYGAFKTPAGLKAAGVILWLITVPTVYISSYAIIALSYKLNYWLGFFCSTWLIYTSLATKNLADEAFAILAKLRSGDLQEARARLGGIVGRDTQDLPVEEICRATVETVAENTVDGIISPIFYAFLGGGPLALAFKAASTLDSMVGYKNERYIHFGWFSARMDDLLNFIPARLGGLLILTASLLLGLDAKRGFKTVLSDAGNHESPNAGIPEAAVAGALGIRLGGWNSYSGSLHFSPYMGQKLRDIKPEDIKVTVALSIISAFLALVTGEIIILILA